MLSIERCGIHVRKVRKRRPKEYGDLLLLPFDLILFIVVDEVSGDDLVKQFNEGFAILNTEAEAFVAELRSRQIVP